MKNQKPAALPQDASAPARTKRVSTLNVEVCWCSDFTEAQKRMLLERLRAEVPAGVNVSG
jgi:hypothetical protein